MTVQALLLPLNDRKQKHWKYGRMATSQRQRSRMVQTKMHPRIQQLSIKKNPNKIFHRRAVTTPVSLLSFTVCNFQP